MKFFFAVVLTLSSSLLWGQSAVVFLYHHVDKTTPASTSIDPKLFSEQMEYLRRQGFKVWPLDKIADYVIKKKSFPERVVGISFDDAYVSVYRSAWPILKRLKFPFTVFTATAYISEQETRYASWSQLREMVSSGLAGIGHHSHGHDHLIFRNKGESSASWKGRVHADLVKANEIFLAKLARKPKLYAHPYGEFSPELNDIVAGLGMRGFGQQSGPAGRYSDPQAIPRFPMTNVFGALEEFKKRAVMQQLPVLSFSPKSPLLRAGGFTFTMQIERVRGLRNLQCFDAQGRHLKLEGSDTKYWMKVKGFKQAGRHKFNCTAQQKEKTLWYSFPWVVPN